MARIQLPELFQDLEPFASAWALSTERERIQQRQTGEPAELRAFYDAMVPRLNDALSYLDQYSLSDMPEDARTLFYMILSLAGVGLTVEADRSQSAGRYFDSTRFVSLLEDGIDHKRSPARPTTVPGAPNELKRQ